MSIACRILIFVCVLVAGVQATDAQTPGDGDLGDLIPDGEVDWCYQDNSNTTCTDAIVYLYQEGQLPPLAVLRCTSCSETLAGGRVCDNNGALLPLPNNDTTLNFAKSAPYFENGKDSFTEGAIVSCGTLKQCLPTCYQITVTHPGTGVVQTAWHCKRQDVNNNMPIKERVASGEDCELQKQTGPPILP